MTSSVHNLIVLVAQMKTVIAAIAEYDRHLEALCQTHDDYHLFAALPGAGSGRLPMNWCASPASLQSSSAAADSSASVGATFVPSSFAKLFMSLPPNPSRTLSGPALSTSASAPKAKTTTPPSAPWLSNGFGSSGSAGTLAPLTTRLSISRVCGRRDRRCSSSPPTIHSESLCLAATSFFLTCHPQLSSVAPCVITPVKQSASFRDRNNHACQSVCIKIYFSRCASLIRTLLDRLHWDVRPSVRNTAPVDTSHSLTVPSKLPLARTFPSGLKAME
jgi:hypothetical protein